MIFRIAVLNELRQVCYSQSVSFLDSVSAHHVESASAAITTVGYGEITPRSFLGRLITVPLLVFGLLLIALPTFVLGREFSVVWDLMKENEVGMRIMLMVPSD